MSRKAFVLTGLAALLLLIGCHSSATGTVQATPGASIRSPRYLTALEAYEEIRPTMRGWHEDAFVYGIFSSRSERSEKRVRADGRAIEWNFSVYSPGAQRLTDIAWENGKIQVGISDAPGGEIPGSGRPQLPVERMIDSDRAVEIALQNGASVNDTLYYVTIHRYDGKTGRDLPPSWTLTYNHLYDLSQQMVLMIDVMTGEVWRNDFNPPPPTATPVRPPAPDQLLIRAYGEFDLYITNPQGQSLGIEPESGRPITEIPAAGYDPDSDVMTEDNVHLASALIMNPVEGRYRVQVHGPGEPEKRCRLSVEVRTGAGEEVLREVEIPCREEVSQVYEFTLSLSGGELLSEVVLVQE